MSLSFCDKVTNKNSNNCLLRNHFAKETIITVFICDTHATGCIHPQLSYKCSANVNDLKQCITTAAMSVDEDMLWCVWNKLDYRIGICHVTKGSHTERL
jgi:hypothetical protein